MAIPDDEPPRPFGAVQLSVRMKEMRALGVRRAGRGQSFDYEAWLDIYAETYGKRYGSVDRYKIAHDARLACIPFTPDELDEAVTKAEYALAADPTHSAYSVAMIGEKLAVTLKERMDGLTHLGCCEESDEERAERRKAEKKERDAQRRPKKPEGWGQEFKSHGRSSEYRGAPGSACAAPSGSHVTLAPRQ